MRASCIVLAGGRSRRMGTDKKSVELGGKTFLERVVESARGVCGEVIVSVASETQRREVEGMALGGAAAVVDEEGPIGPLGGLLTALKRCTGEYALVLTCDSPALRSGVLRQMLEEIGDHDALIPRDGDRIHPLQALYRTDPFLAACEEAMGRGIRDVKGAVARMADVRYISVEEFRAQDRELLTFFNVNTPGDLERLKALLGAG
ncbi:MAG: molybdenum cofactor guanylyltransferase [Euryarchaeota archaeon]|nr:molybdenum cofactor guanylyltransferase [Euryarchaeota archaeon]